MDCRDFASGSFGAGARRRKSPSLRCGLSRSCIQTSNDPRIILRASCSWNRLMGEGGAAVRTGRRCRAGGRRAGLAGRAVAAWGVLSDVSLKAAEIMESRRSSSAWPGLRFSTKLAQAGLALASATAACSRSPAVRRWASEGFSRSAGMRSRSRPGMRWQISYTDSLSAGSPAISPWSPYGSRRWPRPGSSRRRRAHAAGWRWWCRCGAGRSRPATGVRRWPRPGCPC
jgi:hypothetical protein